MESNTTAFKPVAAATPTSGRRETAESAGQTDLPDTKTVNPVAASEKSEAPKDAPRYPLSDAKLGSEDDREIEIDPETREVLFKVTDAETGMVRWQVPAEALLNLRAYNTENGVPTTKQAGADDDADQNGPRLTRDL
jgi:hypothetical protein